MAAVIDSPTNVISGVLSADDTPRGRIMTLSDRNSMDTAVELGIWLSGLESFLSGGHYAFRSRDAARPVVDSSNEFRIAQSTLMRCLRLNAKLTASGNVEQYGLTASEADAIAVAMSDAIKISQCIVRTEPLGIGEWKAWSNLLREKFGHLAAFHKLIRHAENCGEQFLPEPLKTFAEIEAPMSAENAELALVLPRFAKVLKWLSVVGKMLEADEPLKPALVIFSRVNDQISDLLTYINNRLERFPNEEAELFGALDAASYTASIELRKVYSHELAGLAGLRPPPSIHACLETAYSMLNESFQQTLAGLARLIDPSINVVTLFPSYQVNFDRSIALRSELWRLVRLTQAAESEPETSNVESLNKALRDFMSGTVQFLFYKDIETFERFVEEILVTKQNKDLVPILHRFGAYLETLFGQVSMRGVLEKHPFNGEKK